MQSYISKAETLTYGSMLEFEEVQLNVTETLQRVNG